MATPAVFVIHENPEWLPPLAAAFTAEGVPLTEWLLTGGSIDLAAAPPEGVFWSRLSASAHTRDHADTKDFTRAVLTWLEGHGRRVVNGRHVVELEVSKVAQYTALANAGFDVPRTIAVFGRQDLSRRAREFELPFIAKHNEGGKGLGVRRFDSYEDFDAYATSAAFEAPSDGITLLQEYLRAAEPFVTRVEFVGGRYVYAVRVDISAGSFELCPADACEVPQVIAGAICDADGNPAPDAPPPFSRRLDFDDHPIVERYRAFLEAARIDVAGIECIETVDGRLVTYDVNTNTNYNPAVEAEAPRSGPGEIARYLGRLLQEQYGAALPTA
ncbi:MAG: alpha-L-glutamate ligase [Candidatus Dormiibacterota bacterium]